MENLKRQVRLGWLRHGRDRGTLAIRRRLTEPSQVETGEVARKAECRRQAGLEIGRCEVQETACRAPGEGCMHSFPDRTVQSGTIQVGDLSNVEMALGR
jgi:hypothetical protein